MRIPDALEKLGGFASRAELVELRCYPDYIQLSVNYRKILRVRKGWYASLNTPPPVLRALRIGGRLACVSALAQHAQPDGSWDDGTAELHVLVRRTRWLASRPPDVGHLGGIRQSTRGSRQRGASLSP